jgi:hypothetical protein
MQYFTDSRWHVADLARKHGLTRRQAGRICKQVSMDICRRLQFSRAARRHDELYAALDRDNPAAIAEVNRAWGEAIGDFAAQCDERAAVLKLKRAYRNERAWEKLSLTS